MSKIIKHFVLLIVSICSLVVITINEYSVYEIDSTRKNFVSENILFEDYNFAIRKEVNLKYESYDPLQFASHVNSSDNLPCATIAGYHYRLEEKKNPTKWDEYDVIPEWNFFINIYKTNLAIDDILLLFIGIE